MSKHPQKHAGDEAGREIPSEDLDRLSQLARRIGTDRIRIILDIIDQNTMGALRAGDASKKKGPSRHE